jgi:hypothetical protein
MNEFKEKFVAFIDILGFKSLVKNAEAGASPSLDEINEMVALLGSPNDRAMYERNGPMVCPRSKRIENHLDFRLTSVSDCAIISTELSPAGAINLIAHCSTVVMNLLTRGIMCRGYIGKGAIFHSEDRLIGSGYQKRL